MFTPYYMNHLATFVPVPPLLRPVDSALASGLQVFDALWSADSRAQGLEPTNRKVTDYNDSGHGNKKKKTLMERFSTECRKTRIKEIHLDNQKRYRAK